MKTVAVVLSLLFSSLAFADCESIMPNGEPSIPNSIRLCRPAESYLTSYNPDCKIPYYSAEIITAENVNGTNDRRNNFKEDEMLPEAYRSKLSDYKGTGFDRGHMAPAADFRYSADAMSSSFLLSNMVPQYHNANAGVWSAIESFAREKATSLGKVRVISGPVVTANSERIGNGVCVPTHTFKIIVESTGHVTAFIVPNTKDASSQPPYSYEVPVSEVEKLTGVSFNL